MSKEIDLKAYLSTFENIYFLSNKFDKIYCL